MVWGRDMYRDRDLDRTRIGFSIGTWIGIRIETGKWNIAMGIALASMSLYISLIYFPGKGMGLDKGVYFACF